MTLSENRSSFVARIATLLWSSRWRNTGASALRKSCSACSDRSLNRLRAEVFLCRSVSLSRIAFQACSFNYENGRSRKFCQTS